jgi:tetratricopeptide (TPR) repeat protein
MTAPAEKTAAWRHWPWYVAAVVACGISIWAGSRLLHRPSLPIPRVEIGNMHPAVTDLLERQRERVVAQPQSADAWGGYGMSLQQHERFREALVCYERASELAPQNPRWPYYVATIQQQTDAAAALIQFQRVNRLDPDYAPALLQTAELLMRRGEDDRARRLLADIRPQNPGFAMACLLNMRLLKTDATPDQVNQLLQRAAAASAGSQELVSEAAQILMRLGDTESARGLLSQSVTLPPVSAFEFDPWLNELAAFDARGAVTSMQADRLRQQGQLQQAAGLFARLARRFPDRSRPALNHALTLAESGNTDAALRIITELQQRFPEDPLIHFQLAFVQFQQGNLSDAEQQLLRAVEVKDDYADAWGALADVYARTDRTQAAMTAFERATAAAPENTGMQLAFAEFLLQNEKPQQAAEILKRIELPARADAELSAVWKRLHAVVQDANATSPARD